MLTIADNETSFSALPPSPTRQNQRSDISIDLEQEALHNTAKGIGNILELYISSAQDQAESLAGQPVLPKPLAASPKPPRPCCASSSALPTICSPPCSSTRQASPWPALSRAARRWRQASLDREYFKAVMGGEQAYVTKTILKGKTSNALLFVAAHAVKDAAGKTIGMVIVSPILDNFAKRYLDTVRFGGTPTAAYMSTPGHRHCPCQRQVHAAYPAWLRTRPSSERALALKNDVMKYDFKSTSS